MALFLAQAAHWITSQSNSSSASLHSADSERSNPYAKHKSHAGAIPIIASPVDPKAYAWLRRKQMTQSSEAPVHEKIRRSTTVAQFEQEGSESNLAGRIFRKQHAAAPLELFFDLFFVANLAVFTTNHEHIDAQSIANYIGFFSVLWTTWFHSSIYDVRFYVDCVWIRFCKTITFGVMTALVGLGPVYDAIDEGTSTRAFHGLALVLMLYRFLLTLQYGVVLYFVQGFQKTLVPLLLMMSIYLVSGIAFLVTYLVDQNVVLDGTRGALHVYAWYIILGVEAICVMVVSTVWRVLSFKHTHFVERLGLLTLIVTGEGIIGLLKSIAYVLMGTNIDIWAEFGIVAAGVALIYLIYLMYFENIDHDRFGTIRQQVWAVAHYFLHIAILLTVEGQTALIIWQACRNAMIWLAANFPTQVNVANSYNSTDALYAAVTASIDQTTTRYHYYKISYYYPTYTDDLAALQHTSQLAYASEEWNTTTSEILSTIRHNLEYYLFNNFNAKAPADELEAAKDPLQKVRIFCDSFRVVFAYFYIGAGGLLLLLALMYAFGKTKKITSEYLSIGVRVIVGLALPPLSAIAFLEEEGARSSFRYTQAGWITPIVTLSFLMVLVGDSVINVIFDVKRHHEHKGSSRVSTMSDMERGEQAKLTHLDGRPMSKKVQHERDASDLALTSTTTANQTYTTSGSGGWYSGTDSAVHRDEHEHEHAEDDEWPPSRLSSGRGYNAVPLDDEHTGHP